MCDADKTPSLANDSTTRTVEELVATTPSIKGEQPCVLDGSLLQPCWTQQRSINGDQPDSMLDDAEVSELSARFVDSLDLLPPLHAPGQVTPAYALEKKEDAVDPVVEETERKKFNEGMEVISRFAEDVVKTWFAQMYNRDLKELFPDGLIGHTASIKMIPSKEMLEERKRLAWEKRKAEYCSDDEFRDLPKIDTSGWELKLSVVDANHRENLMRWREEESGVLQQMQGLLKTAWGYIQYALESYALPHPELFVEKVIPSPWGTLYVLGALPESPQIGVSIVRCEADPSDDVKNGL